MKRVFLLICVTLMIAAGTVHAKDEPKVFPMFVVESSGVKFWQPSVIVVEKGDKVEIKAKSMIKQADGTMQPHGLKIKEFGVEAIVGGKEEILSFEAKKTGVYTIGCHLHPPHVPAQLLVIDN